ncbi:MAG: sugar ABC transporter ATP-binding protein, partial [Alphaproteobacteria bacterium]
TSYYHEILIMDEMIGAGDAAFIEQAEKRLAKYVDNSGILVVATHSADTMLKWCNKGMLLSKGELVAFGPAQDILDQYNLHR